MKIFGYIIIVLCIIANVVIGFLLLGSSLIEQDEIKGIAQGGVLNSQVKLNDDGTKTISYNDYGFSITIPKGLESFGSDIKTNLVEGFISSTTQGAYAKSLEVHIYNDDKDTNPQTVEEYKKVDKEFYEQTYASSSLKYIDGGIVTNSNKVKIYFDKYNLLSDGKLVTQKFIQFFDKGNRVEMFWIDNVEEFNTSVADFDKVIDSIKVY